MVTHSLDKASLALLDNVDDRLREVVIEVASKVPIRVLEGQRSTARQRLLLTEGRTRTMRSAHLVLPKAKAVDIAPITGCKSLLIESPRYMFAMGRAIGVAMVISSSRGLRLRAGGDFDTNGLMDDSFFDAFHMEVEGYADEPDTRWP